MAAAIDEHPSEVARGGQGEPRARACTRNGARTQVDVNEPWEIFHLPSSSHSRLLLLLFFFFYFFFLLLLLDSSFSLLAPRVRTSFISAIFLPRFLPRYTNRCIDTERLVLFWSRYEHGNRCYTPWAYDRNAPKDRCCVESREWSVSR